MEGRAGPLHLVAPCWVPSTAPVASCHVAQLCPPVSSPPMGCELVLGICPFPSSPGQSFHDRGHGGEVTESRAGSPGT